jgi:hypothetical protein
MFPTVDAKTQRKTKLPGTLQFPAIDFEQRKLIFIYRRQSFDRKIFMQRFNIRSYRFYAPSFQRRSGLRRAGN